MNNQTTPPHTVHLHYDVLGDQNLPPLLLVHGFLSSNLQWELNVRALQKHFRLFLVELWGHGDSAVPPTEGDYSIERYVEEFEHIRQQNNIEQWSLVGQSYGGGLVMHYAKSHPDHCKSLVITNSLSALSPPGAIRATDGFENTIRTQGVKALPIHPSYSRSLPDFLKQRMIDKADNIQMEAVLNGLRLIPKLSAQPFLTDLPKMLIANGIREKAFQAVAEATKENCPSVRVVNMDGGHAVNINCADAFNQAVTAFLLG